MNIERCPLGGSGDGVSRIAFGCWTIGGHGWGKVEDAESILAVQRAMDIGINFFDTADTYGLGHSEEILAKALGTRRTEVVIATKFGVKWDRDGKISIDIGRESLLEALHGSLRRLKIDCIPLYQVHKPDGKTPVAETIETLVRCKEAGKIRAFGCCNMTTSQFMEANRVAPLATVQIAYSLVDQTARREILPFCKDSGITSLAWAPLGHGLLTGKCGPASSFGPDDIRSRDGYFSDRNYAAAQPLIARLQAIGRERKKTAAQVALRWVLDTTDGAALTGIRSADQIDENIGAMGWHLSAEELSDLSSYFAAPEAGSGIP